MGNMTKLFGILPRALQNKVHNSFTGIILDKRADQTYWTTHKNSSVAIPREIISEVPNGINIFF